MSKLALIALLLATPALAHAEEPGGTKADEAEKALLDAIQADPTLLDDAGVIDNALPPEAIVAGEAGVQLDAAARDGLRNLAIEAAQYELDVVPQWVCSASADPPWPGLTPPEHDSLTWCFRSSGRGWVFSATTADRTWCVSSQTPDEVEELEVKGDCSPP